MTIDRDIYANRFGAAGNATPWWGDLAELIVYDRALTTGRGLLRIVGHSDPVLDAQGRQLSEQRAARP